MITRRRGFWLLCIGMGATLLTALAIIVLMLAPVIIEAMGSSDKFYHMIAFACLAFPLPLIRPGLTLWVIVAATAYGGLIELIQPYFGRASELGDLVADGTGAVIGASSGYLLAHYIRSLLPAPPDNSVAGNA